MGGFQSHRSLSRRRTPSARSRQRHGPWRIGGIITPGQDVLYGLRLLLHCRELLSEVLDSVPEEAGLGDGGVKKASFVDIPHLSQVQPKMPFLNHQGGHRLTQGAHRDFHRPEGEVGRRAQLLQQPWLSTTLVQLFQSFRLMDLQDGHGVQGRSRLSSGGVRAAVVLPALDGRRGRFRQVAADCGHKCTAIARSTCGMSTYPLAAPPSRVVRVKEAEDCSLAV
ncbi:uncharacterized protein LOC125280192 [Megalobrama amblycephala]|uniref:uncharacterized protein LOC125280192 n=1 Tax=Megalobrama amblycephala TaxID=75352 RepID=UPI00201427F8|nr:uncharacterized protein LOC125280192 [Megalobrama amblycephala]